MSGKENIYLEGEDMQTNTALALAMPEREIPVGQFRTFGPFGPKYEVGAKTSQLPDGEWMVEVTLVENGETFEYRLSDLMTDPRE